MNTINGTAENDDLAGTSAGETLNGLGGNDTIRAGAGNDNVYGDDDDDRLFGDDGGDYLFGGIGNDLLYGGAGDDQLSGGDGNDRIYGETGDNILYGNAGDDFIYGSSGGDSLDGGAGADRLIGGDGSDTYWVDSTGDRVIENANEGLYDAVSTEVSFRLSANIENLYLYGNAATGHGNALDNGIFGDFIANTLYGFDGNDVLGGGFGDDRVYGGNGVDIIFGEDGNDLLDGGAGADDILGGTGDDIYEIDHSGDRVTEYSDQGLDTVRAQVDYVLGDNVERLVLFGTARVGTGNTLDNSITGTSGGDTLSGVGGSDIIRGGTGRDFINGGDGRDVIYGGVGEDFVTGGLGNDLFRFDEGDARIGENGFDTITDFSQSQNDRIILSTIDANSSTAGVNDAFTFIGSDTFHNIAGELRYQQIGTNTFVYGDTNGDGLADFQIRLTGNVLLVGGDFGL